MSIFQRFSKKRSWCTDIKSPPPLDWCVLSHKMGLGSRLLEKSIHVRCHCCISVVWMAPWIKRSKQQGQIEDSALLLSFMNSRAFFALCFPLKECDDKESTWIPHVNAKKNEYRGNFRGAAHERPTGTMLEAFVFKATTLVRERAESPAGWTKASEVLSMLAPASTQRRGLSIFESRAGSGSESVACFASESESEFSPGWFWKKPWLCQQQAARWWNVSHEKKRICCCTTKVWVGCSCRLKRFPEILWDSLAAHHLVGEFTLREVVDSEEASTNVDCWAGWGASKAMRRQRRMFPYQKHHKPLWFWSSNWHFHTPGNRTKGTW